MLEIIQGFVKSNQELFDIFFLVIFDVGFKVLQKLQLYFRHKRKTHSLLCNKVCSSFYYVFPYLSYKYYYVSLKRICLSRDYLVYVEGKYNDFKQTLLRKRSQILIIHVPPINKLYCIFSFVKFKKTTSFTKMQDHKVFISA